MRIAVWGTGFIANEYMQRRSYHLKDDIVAFVDNNKDLWGKKFANLDVISPEKLEDIEFDKLIICTTDYCDEIKEQIKNSTNINSEKVMTYSELEDSIKVKLISEYNNSTDIEIQQIIKYYERHSLNIFGSYVMNGEDKIYPVLCDHVGTPYILFEGKKMFFPRGYKFVRVNNVECIMNILYEQGEHSPHLYIKSENVVTDNMVIVDAGVCEGNFALRYIDKAKKVYLIESDPIWVEVLQRTFEPYKDKVVICDKYLSGEDTANSVTLDTLVTEKIDILKMDIEGYETEALRGAKKVLQRSNAYCAVCSYHGHDDEQKIKKLLQQYGYNISTSEGYMFFPYDNYIEFRRGIVYGQKAVNDGE